jgi:hypothetical protein
VTRRRIALVCAVAGLTVVGATGLVDAIATDFSFFDCYPDPYFPEPCMDLDIARRAPLSILVACWLIATYILARREAIRPFGCVVMGLMLWFGFLAAEILTLLALQGRREGDGFDIMEIVQVALIGAPFAVAVIGPFTAGVGLWMEATIRDHRRKRLSRASA